MNMTNTNTQQTADLSTKNLTILEDQLNSEALSNKKLNLYASYCTDTSLKSVCDKAAKMHRQHFDNLYNYLCSHNKPQSF